MKRLGAFAVVGLVIIFGIVTNANAASCYESSVVKPSPFMGNDGEIFQLADGTVWEVKYEYEYLYEYYPDVVICPDSQVLIIKGKKLNVQQIK